MSEKDFIKKYLNDLSSLIIPDEEVLENILKVKDILVNTSKNNGKVMIFGNGGSAAISSHVSVDLTKNAKIRSLNFNEADLITCFSNDYGYERWIEKAIDFYSEDKDSLILISSSGKSKNMINAAKYIKKNNNKLITFTGFKGKNLLSKYGNIKFNVDSKEYNFIENAHQYWLLTLVDIFNKIKK